ncbi:MAG: hypothetical protein AAFR61_10570 [Bacteroidota bacterium]
MGKKILQWLITHRVPALSLLFIGFILYASIQSRGYQALLATRWMNIFNYDDFQTWEQIWAYFRDLRTGIPPFLSLLEVLAIKAGSQGEWIVRDFYRHALILGLVLPFFFTQKKWRDGILSVGLAYLFFHSALIVHEANAQVYDVVLAPLLLLYLLLMRLAAREKSGWQTNLWAILAGCCLALSELTRPFMLALLPILVAYSFFMLKPRSLRRFVYFLIPVLILSGGWHLKLLIVNDGQVVWSNHGGSNLANAWGPLLDWDSLKAELQPEQPPLQVNPWTWDNINTQVHYENSKLKQQRVKEAIFSQPGKAWSHFWYKAGVFTSPRTDMYASDPQDAILQVYRPVVRLLFYVLAVLLLIRAWQFVRKPAIWKEESSILLGITFFLTLLPIIGESGEEARFLITVLPFLMWVGLYAVEEGTSAIRRLIAYQNDRQAKQPED